MLSKFISPNMR